MPAIPNLSTTVDTALWIASEWPGARVFPTVGKMPAHRVITSWKAEATTDVSQIEAWFTGTNYGIGVTGILTIDSDVADDGALAREKWGPYLDDAIVWSGHPHRRSFAFRQTDPPTGDGAWEGGEIKGSGYVVVPPSLHDGGEKCPDCQRGAHPYRWAKVNGHQYPLEEWTGPELAGLARSGEAGAVEVPDQWRTPGKPCRVIARVLDDLTWHPNTRHETMCRAQLRVLRHGEQGHRGAAAALEAVHAAFIASLGTDRTRLRDAASEWDRGIRGAAGEIVADGFTDPLNYGCCPPLTLAPSDIEDAVFGATTVLSDIRQACHARRVGPWGVLGCVLAIAIGETMPHYVTPAFIGDVGSANLYVGLVGAASTGKSVSYSLAKRLINVTDRLGQDNTEAKRVGYATGEGLLAAYLRPDPNWEGKDKAPLVPIAFPAVICYVDEIDQLAQSNGRAGATGDSIARTMWAGGDVGTQTADADRRRFLPAHSYRLSMIAGVQPRRAGHLLSGDAHDSGTAHRWLWMPVSDPNAPDVRPAMPAPLQWQRLSPETMGNADGQVVFTFPAEAEAVIEERRLAILRGLAVPTVADHDRWNRLKVAAALAALHGTTDVDDVLWEVSGHLMAVSSVTRAGIMAELAKAGAERDEHEGAREVRRAAGRSVATEERIEAGADVVRRAVADFGPEGCTRVAITRALRRYRDCADECVDRAVDNGWVSHTGKGRGSRYVVKGGQGGH